jgi:hypothetical protein
MFIFLTNKSKKTSIKSIVHNGQDYYVVPAVLAKVGVMNNYLYTKELLNNTQDAWNGVKVTLRHPKFNGHDASINNPVTADEYAIGELFNVVFEDDKLKGDIYLNKAVIEAKKAESLIERISNNEYVDVSTGLDKVTAIKEEGEFNGKKYKSIINSFKADHLAILPNEKGACSVDDGCGLLFNSSLSFGQITAKLYEIFGQINGKDKYVWIDDVYEDYFIASEDGKLFKQKYTLDGEKITLGDKTPIKKEIIYVEMQANKEDCECKKEILTNKQEDSFLNMKKETIDFLANAELTGVSEDEKKAFDSLSVDTLGVLANKIKPNDADKIFITNAEKKEFDDYKTKKAKEDTDKKEAFKKAFNCDDTVVSGLTIEAIDHLMNQKQPEGGNATAPVDYSGKGGGIVTNSNKISTKPVSMAEMFGGTK